MTYLNQAKIIAETQRLTLRHFCQQDIDSLAEILADPYVMKFSLSGPSSFEKTKKLIDYTLSSYKNNGFGLWAVTHTDSGNLIGYCGHFLQTIDGQQEVELSYRLAKEHWGKGLATEAAKAACHYAFSALGLNRLVSIIDPENTASIRVAEKTGMHYEKDAIFHGIPVRIYAVQKSLTIYPAETTEDFKIAKGLLEDYLALLTELAGPSHHKENQAHIRQMNNFAF